MKKCKDCNKLKELKKFNILLNKKYNKKYFSSYCRECLNRRARDLYNKNSGRKWKLSNYAKCREATIWCLMKKLNRIPKWVDRSEILLIYLNCPYDHEVDHIIPIKGINVYGLHVPWNLQYLTPKENRVKKNLVLL